MTNKDKMTTQDKILNQGNVTQNSLKPAISECERFINFLDERFNLGLPQNYLVTISKATKNTSGYFMPLEHDSHFINTTQKLNNINLNTYYLKTANPYEVLAHETAHFINHVKKVKDASSNGYHNKHFKSVAEKLFLKVERGKKGYNVTTETEEFNKMLEEYKPNREVFNICQNIPEGKAKGSRLKLYVCGCGVKIRCAIELHAKCLNCEGGFELQD